MTEQLYCIIIKKKFALEIMHDLELVEAVEILKTAEPANFREELFKRIDKVKSIPVSAE